ncbi:uncharacterized protein PFL1_01571 [Pseudozyma flocculosa PF-1]|uniref:Uncharacterized protein n=1 Tax=Pseudozyma flocculosa TaxID=84751 RepID=A0A5C3EZZ7_9BASI|nr:uncharacterized protein PFL1_01571 [Pseudozyma flocculosa PF-1]EPQ30670.1 hypothetical protein PFL1_01571 [Pseudozyma flocculosa PF-1]SPO36997.1 uncharacterized protein PSFLO_02469 [Pseudozyma flocculosa]
MRPFTASKYAAAVAVATLASGAHAQLDTSLITGLAPACGQALLGLISNQDLSNCLALTDAVGVLGAAGQNSIVPGLNGYFAGDICPKAPCPSAALTSAQQSISQACQSDLPKGGIPALILFLLSNYDTVRSLGCLKNDQNNQLCLVDTMYAVQNATGKPLTFQSLSGLLSNDQATTQSLMQVAQNKTLLCSACNDALFTVASQSPAAAKAQQGSSDSALTKVAQGAAQTCGAAFTDNKVPDNVKQTATGNSTNPGTSSGSGSGSASTGSSGSNAGKSNAAAAGFQVSGTAVTLAVGLFASGLAVLF